MAGPVFEGLNCTFLAGMSAALSEGFDFSVILFDTEPEGDRLDLFVLGEARSTLVVR